MFEIKKLKFKHILQIDHLMIDRQITCLIGPSGSGKTTLLRMLNRLNEAEEGSIYFNGVDIKEMHPIKLRRKIIMLGQTPILYSGTIADNLQIGLRLSEQPLADENRLLAYLDKVGLHKELNDTCEKLSGGEKQHLCLARVLLMDADVYLADEPSSAMDKETESFVIDNLVTFVKEHDKQLVMVTHSSEIAQRYPHGLLELAQGGCRGYVYE
ncbi:ATP-binding cassette domain-containing protein [Longicatena sp. 210702-DFI.1.36]|uniref:ABC transporter ATP-binding protein n=1 Tax=Longicatena TaxID=1918536 RepID=UPI001D05D723|nr:MULTISPECIES: ATP-binding cassette domain-containing protein [Longicatena]MCB6266365.1 ATP-binding cassette domain-containing protein [Longicatena sp. 210702-DFI.1.160]MCB6316927.1 ATP-binding cassette domain-containing protein [Longicatena sp. 210702-DFI.1.100]MCB6430820.1 ATP-binding cassette domain-containing protein [Longicatena sp. 210702-DFI.1.36]MCB6433866.1 ATP-binding cassette domain-containing protein [Longicatena sp. 210702-DFI.1.249]MCB6440374.1 ATP-binding cassette domain-conta